MSSNGTADVLLSASYQGNVVACAIATWAIAAVFVGLRFYLRGRLMNVLGCEDWTILLSLIFSCGVSASFITESYFGLGRHVDVLTTKEVVKASEASTTRAVWRCLPKVSHFHIVQASLTG